MYTIKNFNDVSKQDGTHNEVIIILNETDEDGEELAIECSYSIDTTFHNWEYGTREVKDKKIDIFEFKIIDVYCNEIEISEEIKDNLITEIKEFLDKQKIFKFKKMKYQIAIWKNLPKEIKLKMLEYQLEQSGKKNKEIFKNQIFSNKEEKGYDWEDTIKGSLFWSEVLMETNFDLYFEKYPKPHFSKKGKKLNDTYNLLGIIKKNKEHINFIKNTFFDTEKWELPEKYYKEVKHLKKINKNLLNQLFELYKKN